jgi:hypothetical protein
MRALNVLGDISDISEADLYFSDEADLYEMLAFDEEMTGARKVTLISSDNQCFELTIKAALGSGLLKEMLDDEAGQNFEIPLPS